MYSPFPRRIPRIAAQCKLPSTQACPTKESRRTKKITKEK